MSGPGRQASWSYGARYLMIRLPQAIKVWSTASGDCLYDHRLFIPSEYLS